MITYRYKKVLRWMAAGKTVEVEGYISPYGTWKAALEHELIVAMADHIDVHRFRLARND